MECNKTPLGVAPTATLLFGKDFNGVAIASKIRPKDITVNVLTPAGLAFGARKTVLIKSFVWVISMNRFERKRISYFWLKKHKNPRTCARFKLKSTLMPHRFQCDILIIWQVCLISVVIADNLAGSASKTFRGIFFIRFSKKNI